MLIFYLLLATSWCRRCSPRSQLRAGGKVLQVLRLDIGGHLSDLADGA